MMEMVQQRQASEFIIILHARCDKLDVSTTTTTNIIIIAIWARGRHGSRVQEVFLHYFLWYNYKKGRESVLWWYSGSQARQFFYPHHLAFNASYVRTTTTATTIETEDEYQTCIPLDNNV